MSRNIVLICLDTVRKDFFDQFAPRLKNLADVSFEQCRAASTWSVPSHASMFTGQLPHQHGIHTDNPTFSDLGISSTFMGELDEYSTYCVSANVWASSTFGFANIFDEYSDISFSKRFAKGAHMKEFHLHRNKDSSKYSEFLRYAINHKNTLYTLLNGIYSKSHGFIRKASFPSMFDDGANSIIDHSLEHITEGSEPFFLFTNFMDAHGPMHNSIKYDGKIHDIPWFSSQIDFDYWDVNLNNDYDEKTQRSIENYRDMYRAAIDYLDRKIVDFIKNVKSSTDNDTTFIITADHGENLAYDEDEGLFNHVSSLSESLLHVPLYIVNPPEGYCTREPQYFSHLDLGKLIVGLSNDRAPNVFHDQIAAELIGGNIATRRTVPEDELSYWDRMQRCVYSDEQKFVWDSLGESYKYRLNHQKPCWQNQVAKDVEIPESWMDLFGSEIEAVKQEVSREDKLIDVDAATESRLEDLGYL